MKERLNRIFDEASKDLDIGECFVAVGVYLPEVPPRISPPEGEPETTPMEEQKQPEEIYKQRISSRVSSWVDKLIEEAKKEVKEEIKEEITEGIKEEITEEAKEEIKEEIKEEVKKEIKEEVDTGGYTGPAVFICPERCVEWGKKTDIPSEFVFIFMLYHEYAHAFMDEDTGNQHFRNMAVIGPSLYKGIEESLANLIVLTRFKTTKDKARAHLLILNQPLEYQGALFLNDRYLQSKKFRIAWEEWWEEWWWWWYRHRWPYYPWFPYFPFHHFGLVNLWKRYKSGNMNQREKLFAEHLAVTLADQITRELAK